MHRALFKKLIAISALAIFAIISFGTNANATDVTVFPPANMTSCLSTGAKFLSWAQGETGTSCASGQDVFNNALPNCAEGQQIVKKNGAFACQDPLTPGTCAAGQVLTYTSAGFTCVDVDNREVPTCAAGSFLTFDGTHFVCTGVPTVNLSCPAGKVLQGIANSQPVCVDGGSGGGSQASCTVYTFNAPYDRPSYYNNLAYYNYTVGIPDGVNTIYATKPVYEPFGKLITTATTIPDGRIFTFANDWSSYVSLGIPNSQSGASVYTVSQAQCQNGKFHVLPQTAYVPASDPGPGGGI